MTFSLRVLLAALVLAVSACAPAANPASAGPALWRLADADSEIWLFGSVHVLPPDLKWRTARIDRAFDSAETLYLETPVDMPAQAAIADIVTRYGYNPPGVTLSGRLDAADRARLLRACARFNIDPAAMERTRPWLAATQLSVAQVLAQGQAAYAGVEQVLDQEARARHKARAYFETSEEQIRFLADLPPEAELQYLTSTLRDLESEDQEVDRLDRAWARGDMKTLSRELAAELRDSGPQVYDALIRNRNERWADEIDRMMKGSGKIFITVGAAHLIGEDGVPALLRKKGYRVEGP
ncbi:MAG TPA: TraB/GumN family protein [Caulobacterales bacterium]|nr:TraB/GumN family protein [Caulobacterales bacterium]